MCIPIKKTPCIYKGNLITVFGKVMWLDFGQTVIFPTADEQYFNYK